MICKFCKRTNHKTFDCFFRRKNRIKNRKPSFQNKAPKFDKITEPAITGPDSKSVSVKSSLDQNPKTEEINSGLTPVQNSNKGLKPLSGENSLNQKSKTENLDSNFKFEKLISKPDSKSGWKEGNKTLEKRVSRISKF